MRGRLTVSILVLVAVTLIVTSIGSYYFIQRAALSTAQQELSRQGHAISSTISSGATITSAGFRREVKVIAEAGAFQGIDLVALHPDGTITGDLPAGITV